jgi:hypothetical protein
MTKKCEVCQMRESVWYGQQMEGPNEKLSYAAPGWHYRGFAIHPMCDECWQILHNLTATQIADIIKQNKES